MTQDNTQSTAVTVTPTTAPQAPSLMDRLFSPRTIRVEPRVTVTMPEPRITVYVNDERAKDVRVETENTALAVPTDPLAAFRVPDEPYYNPAGGERELFATAYKHKLPVMLKGPTGCGKTRLIEHMAHKLSVPLITVSCNEDTRASDLVGRMLIDGERTYFQDGPLTKAVRHGGICYLDEVVEARSDAMVLIHSLTDHRRILPIDKTGENLHAHPNFLLVVSYNPHYQSSIKEMKQSTRQRFVAFELDYLTAGEEAKVVMRESDVPGGTARMLVDLAHEYRELRKEGLPEGASTRLLVYAGQLMKSGVDKRTAIRTGIVNPITDDVEMQQRMMEIAGNYAK